MQRKLDTTLTLNKITYPLLEIPNFINFDATTQELYLFFTKGVFIRYSIDSALESITYR